MRLGKPQFYPLGRRAARTKTECYDFLMDPVPSASGGLGQPAGFVLAGGRSARMGRDKALLPWGHGLLIQHVAAEVAAFAGSATIVGGADACRSLGFPYFADKYPGFGPVGAIATALSHSDAEWNVIAACDMPMLTAAFLESLYTRVSPQVDAVIPRTPDGRIHPLCALYRRSVRKACESAVANSIHRVSDLISGISAEYVNTVDGSFCRNVNTPADWRMVSEVMAHAR
ncbi:MAG TPA: molybdenum cofactor guanylyltransferase [Bryobacteraceae bacterium]|nr:molybdenum cofactor guanylyltransferase [Bryobacteraceae bacterium]